MSRKLAPLDLTPDVIDAIIADVKASKCFGKSARQLRLFTYILKYPYLENSAPITQYAIALDVLDRADSFDPTVDSIVRVEMHRLRGNLEDYNKTKSEFHLTIPSASYEVVAQKRAANLSQTLTQHRKLIAGATIAATAAIGLSVITVTAMPPAIDESCSQILPNLNVNIIGTPSTNSRYVENVLRSAMSQHTGFNVLEAGQSCTSQSAPSFDVAVAVAENDQTFGLALTVKDKKDGSIIESYHADGNISDTRANTPLYFKLTEIATSIALSSGTIARKAYNGDWPSTEAKRNYGCLISMYDSFSGGAESDFDDVHSCLEASTKTTQPSLDNLGALASSYLDQARNTRRSTLDDPFLAAEQILEAHGDSWIDSQEIAIAKLFYEAYHPDFNAERLNLVVESITSRYSANPVVLLNASVFEGYSLGRWEEALALAQYSRKIYAIRDQSVYAVDAGYAFISEAPNVSYDDCYKFYAKNSPFVNLIINGCARLEGNSYWRDLSEKNLIDQGLISVEDRMALLTSRVNDPKFISKYENILHNQKEQ